MADQSHISYPVSREAHSAKGYGDGSEIGCNRRNEDAGGRRVRSDRQGARCAHDPRTSGDGNQKDVPGFRLYVLGRANPRGGREDAGSETGSDAGHAGRSRLAADLINASASNVTGQLGTLAV